MARELDRDMERELGRDVPIPCAGRSLGAKAEVVAGTWHGGSCYKTGSVASCLSGYMAGSVASVCRS